MKDKPRILIRTLIVMIGIGVLVYPSLSEYLTQQNASRAVASYDDTVAEMTRARLDEQLEEARNYNAMLASSTGFQKPPTDAKGQPITPASYDNTLNIDSSGMMGYITIPKLNVTCRILHGTDEATLQVAVGHMKNTSLPVGGDTSHAVLSGHRGLPTAELFTDLDRLEIGDVFYIKTLDHTLCYTVDQILTVLPDETDELRIQHGKDYVTLVTCTPYGVNSHRLLVRGVRTPYDESGEIPIYKTVDMRSFFQRLPAQYRHMLFGVAAIIVFLVIYWTVILIRNHKGRSAPENDTDNKNGEKT